MKFLLLFTFLLSHLNAFALDAVVTVLEAPVFKNKSLDAKIIQYLRKGDVIKIHPGIAQVELYDDLSPGRDKIEKIKNEMQENGQLQDPLFPGKFQEEVSVNDEFIPIIDRSGSQRYVLSKHIYVYFEDNRELNQTIANIDETDYRLKEPLPPKYPLSEKSGYRGQALLGFSQPYSDSYPYLDDVKTKGYSSPIELFFSFLNQPRHELRDRFYFGPSFRIRRFQNTFTFLDKRQSEETYFEFGLGPIIQFDAYKGEKNRLNLSFNIHFQPYNFLKITQSGDEESESRTYSGYGLSSRLGVYYHRKSISENLDFVFGTSLDLEAPLRYQAQNGAGKANWWKNLGADSFRPKTLFGITTSFGLQAAY